MVKQSWTSATFTSLAVTLAMRKACCPASTAEGRPTRLGRRNTDILAVAQPTPSNQTTFLLRALARLSSANIRHAAPSALAQQSYTQNGDATASECIALSNWI